MAVGARGGTVPAGAGDKSSGSAIVTVMKTVTIAAHVEFLGARQYTSPTLQPLCNLGSIVPTYWGTSPALGGFFHHSSPTYWVLKCQVQ